MPNCLKQIEAFETSSLMILHRAQVNERFGKEPSLVAYTCFDFTTPLCGFLLSGAACQARLGRDFYILITLAMSQATQSNGHEGSSLPLYCFNKNMPPGWGPDVADYPCCQYSKLLEFWWSQTELPLEARGPAMTGRLHGAAFQFAMALTVTRYDVNTGAAFECKGADLASQPQVDSFQLPDGSHTEVQPCGAQVLLKALTQSFNMSVAALDASDDTHRKPDKQTECDMTTIVMTGLMNDSSDDDSIDVVIGSAYAGSGYPVHHFRCQGYIC